MYPRGDVKESEVQTHRLLRRGIPYGEPSLSSPTAPVPDTEDADRGLLFLAYQTSIENQFEFLQDQANKINLMGRKSAMIRSSGRIGWMAESDHFSDRQMDK